MFVEKTEVFYNGMCGIIDFVCDQYIVIKLPAASSKHNSPRLLVYSNYYDKVKVIKESDR